MTKAEKALLTELAVSIEYWTKLVKEEAQESDPTFSWASKPESLKDISKLARDRGFEKQLGDFAYELLYGFTHNVLTVFDGGSEMSDRYSIDIVESDGTPFCKYLHELLPDIRYERESSLSVIRDGD